MREMMWVFAVIILSVCETWSLQPGTSQSTFLMSNTSSSAPPVNVVRDSSFSLGSDVNLTCSDKPWSEIMFVIWDIKLKHKHCVIVHNSDGQSKDTCNDGKSVRNTSRAQPYLHIPNFSNDDVGIYKCDTVYSGGTDAYVINVAIIGTSQSTFLMSNTSSSAPPVNVVRDSSFSLGSDVNLTCGDKPWSEIMFVIWDIKLKYKHCVIVHNNEGQSTDTCNDGKSVQNTSRAQPYLHIPNFSNDDVGIYKCETVYSGGTDAYVINVAIIVPPNISAWLEWKGNEMVAVCKAERGKPAANINWSHTGNSSSLETGSDGFFTVESHLELPENMDTKNLSCTIRHPYWEGERTLVPKPTKGLDFTPMWIRMVVIIIAIWAGLLFFAKKKTNILRCCRQADTSSEPLPTEDV